MQERYDFPKRRAAGYKDSESGSLSVKYFAPARGEASNFPVSLRSLALGICSSCHCATSVSESSDVGDEQEKQHDPGNTEGKKAGDEQQEVNNKSLAAPSPAGSFPAGTYVRMRRLRNPLFTDQDLNLG